MALKKLKKPQLTQKNIESLGREYAELSQTIIQLDSRKKELADLIKKGAEEFGVKDDKGSFYLESDEYVMGKVSRQSFSLDQEKAVKTLESLGLGDLVDVVTTKVVNEDKLNKAVSEGRVSFDTVEGFTNVKTSYSVLVKEKEEVPMAEQSNLKVARRK